MLAPQDVSAFAATSRFMALATVDTVGPCRTQSKGRSGRHTGADRGGRTCFAERPGNRVSGYHLAQPPAAAMVLVLGSGQVARVSGNARISADQTARAQFVFRDETSALVAIIEDAAVAIGESRRFCASTTGPAGRAAKAAAIRRDIEPDRDTGLGAELASAAVSVPGVSDLLRKGLETDHRD